MKGKKWYIVFLYTTFCIFLNIAGRVLADKLSLPIWFDSLGTVVMAYVGGPVCGALVGLFNNIIYGIFVDQQSIYCLVGVFIGIFVGIRAKKKVFEDYFEAITLGMILAVLCAIASVPLSIITSNGEIGNIWGDQVAKMLESWGLHRVLAITIGQFFIEFLDKLITISIVYTAIKVARKISNNNKLRKKYSGAISVILALVCAASLIPTLSVKADESEHVNKYNEYTQSVYSGDEGLLGGGANVVEQTKDGKILVGTYAGLYSYDGSKFKLLKDIDSVKNVNTMFVDEEGRIWIGTNDNGCTIMTSNQVMNVIDESNGLPSNVVKGIECDNLGNYYIGTSNGLAIVTLSSGVKMQKLFYNIDNIMHMTADDNGNVIVVTDAGEIVWLQNGEIIGRKFSDIESYGINTAFFNESGDLYFGTTGNQVIICKMVNGSFKKDDVIKCDGLTRINSFYETADDEIFICSDGGAGYFDNNGKYHFINTNDFSSSIDNMIVDYQGDLWFSSSRLGLLRMCKSSFTEVFPEVGAGKVVNNAVTRWNGLLYCGTDEGIVVVDEVHSRMIDNEVTELLDGTRIRDVAVDSNNRLWISTTGMGIYQVEIVGGIYNIVNYTSEDGIPGMRYRQILELTDGTVAVSGDQGVALIKDEKVVDAITADDGLENIKSLCVMEYNNALYIGSDGGGIAVVKNGEVTDTITREDGLSSNVVMKMIYDKYSQGVFIVAGNGLNYMDRYGIVSVLNNFPYYDVFDLVQGEGTSAWVLTSAGIYIADTKDLIANQSKDYELINSRRGLRSSLISNSWYYMDKNDVYLNTGEGVIRVNMKEYDTSSVSYRMILDSVSVDGVRYVVNRNKETTIPSDTLTVEFEPEVLNYSLNDPYISYRLVGFEAEDHVMLLSEMENVVYSNLLPGSYVFKMSVLDANKQDVIETVKYNINVEHEMYENWWFKLYVAIVVTLMIVWVTWFITRTQTRKTIMRQEFEIEANKKQISMGKETIMSIAHAVDAKDSNTSQHSFRVSEYSVAIARRIGFSEEECENLRQMALLHDIGKIGIPDSILNKPARLTEEEYEVMKTHVTRGAEILKDFTLIKNVNYGVLYHHERYDGTGYTKGLKGEQIPIEARIIGIADAFDAMTANRVYRKKLDIDFVMAELVRCSGTQFDPMLVKILLSLIEDHEIDVEELYGKSVEGNN